VCTEQKKAGINGDKHLARVQARISAAGDHLVEITSANGRRGEGRQSVKVER